MRKIHGQTTLKKINHFIYQYVNDVLIMTQNTCHDVSVRRLIYVIRQVSAYIKISGVQWQELSQNCLVSISVGDL